MKLVRDADGGKVKIGLDGRSGAEGRAGRSGMTLHILIELLSAPAMPLLLPSVGAPRDELERA